MSNLHEEKIKPFTLVKYFTFTGLILMFLGTVALATINTHWVRSMVLKKSEDYALLLVENLNHQVYLYFVLPVFIKYGKIQLRKKEQFERMDKVVRSTLHSFKVEMVNIYDKDNIISYSFNQNMIGRKNMGGTGYKKALEGQSFSTLGQTGSFWEILIGFPKQSKLTTFAPLRAEKPLTKISGPVLGVVEIVQDISHDYKPIFKLQILVIISCCFIMGALFLILRLIVKRGEGIIQKRAMERIALKEQLSKAKHLSAIGEMTAGISHEIRNPLGIIMNSAELLKKRKNDKDQITSKISSIIIEETSRLNNIITDFLNFARPKTPNLILCRINEVISKNIAFLNPQLNNQGYNISYHCHNNVPEIKADPTMLYQAFLNILINAMQAMPKGGTITITVDCYEKFVRISFDDEGQGIDNDIIEKIWGPFFTTKDKGTGLGLGIVKNIIEAHQGNITIDNKKTQGVKVTVFIPANNNKEDILC